MRRICEYFSVLETEGVLRGGGSSHQVCAHTAGAPENVEQIHRIGVVHSPGTPESIRFVRSLGSSSEHKDWCVIDEESRDLKSKKEAFKGVHLT